MKKKTSRRIRKLFFRSFTAAFFIAIAILLFFGVKGYSMYRQAIKNFPIDEMVSSIQDNENFVSYEELPKIYIEAVISVEDKRFERHCGFDIIAISRAAWKDITAMSFVEGGSTITQQYEAVMLAGLPNAPSAYSSDDNMDLAHKRMEVVLSRMVENGVLKEDEADMIRESIFDNGSTAE